MSRKTGDISKHFGKDWKVPTGFPFDDESKKELSDRYNTPGLKYMDIKKELIETIISFFETQKLEREKLVLNNDEVTKKMILGQTKAKEIAQKTLQEVKSATGLI